MFVTFEALAQVVHENFGIIEGLMTTVHATTATQKTGMPCTLYTGLHIVKLHTMLLRYMTVYPMKASRKLHKHVLHDVALPAPM